MLKKILIVIILVLLVIVAMFLVHFYFPPDHEPTILTYKDWDNGNVHHILPAANHDHFLIKTSFKEAASSTPYLRISDSILIEGISSDQGRRFWGFYASELNPATTYSLQLVTQSGEGLTDEWSLQTYPHPDSTAERLKILAFTCAGGVEERVLGQEIFLKMEYRHHLLKKGLGFHPDVVIANGDHIYWDRQTMDGSIIKRLVKLRLDNIYGRLALDQPMLSEHNYKAITKIADAQIVELYGCLLRSTPVYFLPDDHDLFENDEAGESLITLPPSPYGIDGQSTIQDLYYPEFLPDRNRPIELSGSKGTMNRNYGTLRYGDLLEAVLYDCKRYTSLDGDDAVLVAGDAEDWIIDRTRRSEAAMHPSHHCPGARPGTTHSICRQSIHME